MKPTPEQIAELVREVRGAGFDVYGPLVKEYVHNPIELAKLVELALERFGAGGGEPVARLMTWIGMDGYPKKGSTVARTYRECPKDAYPDRWEEGPELYTHPSPAELRAEYLRGLEDAAKVADANATDEPYGHAKFRCVNIAEAIRALKGKQ